MILTTIPIKISEDNKFIFHCPENYDVVLIKNSLMHVCYDASELFVVHTIYAIQDGEELPNNFKFVGYYKQNTRERYLFTGEK